MILISNLAGMSAITDLVFYENGPRHREYQKALDSSLAISKPVLLHFTADYCQYPIKMKELLSSDSTTKELLSNFVYLELSVTDITPLELQDIYENELGVVVKTIGSRNADLEISIYHENVQPLLIIVNGFEKIISTTHSISTPEELKEFLRNGMHKYLRDEH